MVFGMVEGEGFDIYYTGNTERNGGRGVFFTTDFTDEDGLFQRRERKGFLNAGFKGL
jgi:hypothetical protein